MSNSLLGFNSTQGPLAQLQISSGKNLDKAARLVFFGRGEKPDPSAVGVVPLTWQWSQRPTMIEKLAGEHAPVWVVRSEDLGMNQHGGLFNVSPYAMARDSVGGVFREAQLQERLHIIYVGKNEEELLGALVGIEMAAYRFKNLWPKSQTVKLPKMTLEASKIKNLKSLLEKAKALGSSINLARHLVNLPPNALHPKSYGEFLQELFKKSAFKVETWSFERLKKEKMGLHAGVGQAALHKPVLVKMTYRQGGKKRPYAFVGKGITFDSGGLDIKPSSGMRDMKKDMGGSASVVGLAYWLSQQKPKINVDIYLPIAENAVGEDSFHPGDILTSRSGKTVEIHNTDAEGRLVLADSLTLAVESKAQMIINVATLTGAIKVAMGEGVAGMFCNQDDLAERISSCARERGDLCWRMPLDPGQKSKLKSDVADLVNAADGFGGAVTAALFLEAFVDQTPWAHFDIYSWTGPSGVYSEKGGNGQVVQCLARFCEGLSG